MTPSYELLRLIALVARDFELEPALVAGVVDTESGFNPEAVGDAGRSFGLMQLYLEGAGSEFRDNPEALLNPETNLRAGCEYLRDCLLSFRDRGDDSLRLGISAYNQGIAGARQHGLAVNPGYVDSVLAAREKWRQLIYEAECLAHLDAVWGHLMGITQGVARAQSELVALKRAIGLD
jgi:soluble lytic murein transglycosylase-like protein